MTDEPTDEPTDKRTSRPAPDPRFAWHPEPELIGIRDAAISRAALERLGAQAWAVGHDYVYDEAFRRAMGEPAEYGALRRTFFGTTGGPGSARSAGPAAAPTSPPRRPRSSTSSESGSPHTS